MAHDREGQVRSESTDPAPRRRLVALEPEECLALLETAVIGRVVFDDIRGPVAIPVNFRVDGGDIVFRTTPMSSMRASTYLTAGFEVDRIDEVRREGWSVLATGRVSEVTDPADLERLERLVVPWAEGPRTRHLRLVVKVVTGRRLVAADDPPASSA